MEKVFHGITIKDGQAVWIKPNLCPCQWVKATVKHGEYQMQSGTYLYFAERCEDAKGTFYSNTAGGNVAQISLIPKNPTDK